MVRNNSPYVYGEVDDDEVEEEFEAADDPDVDAVARETVIEDGVAMSYRSYQARQDGLRRREL